VITQEFYFPSSDKKHSLRAKHWKPDGEPRGIIYLAHGIAEHIDRYQAFAEFLTQRGILLAANDHLGHGRSAFPPEDVGYFADADGWKYVVQDMHSHVDILRELYPDTPLFMMGHSMGSFLTRCFAITYPMAEVKGYILSGTGHISRFLSGTGMIVCDRELKKLGPRGHSKTVMKLMFGTYNRKFEGRTEYDWLTRDKKTVDAYLADPLCGVEGTVSLYRDLLAQIRFMTDMKNIRKMNRNVPVLLVSGDMDPVGGYGKEVRVYHDILVKEGFSDTACILYEGARHEILNEYQRDDVMADIYSWLEGRLAE